MSELSLSEINIYPIKSLGGISLEEALIEERGLQFDRRWMLVTENGEFLTQREFPKMATLNVTIEDAGLLVKSEAGQSISIPLLPDSKQKLGVSVWGSKCKALFYSQVIDDFFSDILQTNCRLAYMPDDSRRKVSPNYAVRKFQDIVSFADGYPILLIGEGSLDDLNSKLEIPVPMNRFRSNIVIKNSAAFVEDSWKKISVGEAVFHLVKPCARCVMTTIDQQTGLSNNSEPLKTLAKYRLVKRLGKQKINFGMNLIADRAGERIRIGDRVSVLDAKK